MLNRLVIFGWPILALCVLVPLLKALNSPPSLTIVVVTIMGVLAVAIQVAFLDIPDKWLNPDERRRSSED
jgi:hypothetical protein